MIRVGPVRRYAKFIVVSGPGEDINVPIGTPLVIAMPAGQIGQIFVQRNGVDIPGEASVPDVGYYVYTVSALDAGARLSSRIINTSADTVSPRRQGIAAYMATPDEVWIEYSKELGRNTIAASQFSIGGAVATAKTVPSVTVAGNIVKVKCSSNFIPGDKPTVTYIPDGTPADQIQDYAANMAPGFGPVSVFNEFPEPASTAILFTGDGGSNMVVGAGGFVINSTNPGGYAHWLTLPEFGSGSQAAILTVAGWVECQVTDSNAALRVLSMKTNVAGNHISTLTWQVRIQNGIARPYNGSTAVGSNVTFATPGSNCRVRLYRDVPSGEIRFETSLDGGVSWTLQHTFAVVSDLEIEGSAFAYSDSQTVPIMGCALQGFKSRGF